MRCEYFADSSLWQWMDWLVPQRHTFTQLRDTTLAMWFLPWGLALLTTPLLVWIFQRRISRWGLWCGVWFWWTGATIAVAFFLPAASYLLLIPSAVAPVAMLGTLPILGKSRPWIAWGTIALPAVLTGLLWIKVAFGLEEAIGSGMIVAITIPISISLATLTPLGLPHDRREQASEPVG